MPTKTPAKPPVRKGRTAVPAEGGGTEYLEDGKSVGASIYNTYEATRLPDSMLTIKALSKIVGAQQRGSLSHRLRLTRYPTQVVVEGVSDKDLEWIRRYFPEGKEILHHSASKRAGRGRRSTVFDSYKYEVLLREPVQDSRYLGAGYVPRLEVWGILRPHVCGNFQGRTTEKGVRWSCGHYGCRRTLGVREAREHGLTS